MKAKEKLKQFKLELADLMEKYDVHIYVENNSVYFGTRDNVGRYGEYLGQYVHSEKLRGD